MCGGYRLLRQAGLTFRLVRAGRALGPVDVVHANDFETLPAGWLLARRTRARLVYDAHELYAAQEPDPPRLQVAVLGLAEGALARRTGAVVTVSDEIGDELRRRLRLRDQPIVVLSCPANEISAPAPEERGPLRAIYQSAMGPGRSLDDVLEAAKRQSGGVTITVRVLGADREELKRRVLADGLEHVLEIAEPVSPDALVAGLRGFDVGLIIDRPVTRNNALSLPNKLFEYMMAGLAVVAPALESLGPFVERERVGLTFPPGDVVAMAAALDRLAGDRELLRELRTRAKEAAVARFSAEAQGRFLLQAWGQAEPDASAVPDAHDGGLAAAVRPGNDDQRGDDADGDRNTLGEAP
jgi:glycosyltransferase involved in cell wall biosynthesis